MANVRYKAVPESLLRITVPKMEESSTRSSVGLDSNIGEFYFIKIADLRPFKNQARRHFPTYEINALANSIKEHGVRQPLTVIACEGEKGHYEVISGERRLRAAQIAGFEKVPCILLKNSALADEIAIVENIHRQDLHPVELGAAFNKLLSSGIFTTQSEIAEKFSLSKSTVSEVISYADLSDETKQYLIENSITARAQIRQIAKEQSNKPSLEEILQGSKNVTRNFSVMRISMEDTKLKLNATGILKLAEHQRVELKAALQKIINAL